MTAAARIAARHVWTPDGLMARGAVVLDESGRVLSVASARDDELLLDGILMPGFVNAHGHLELSHHMRPVGTPGIGSPAWVGALYASGATPDPFTAERGARAARATGTAFFLDVTNTGTTASAMAVARLRGTMQVECIGLSKDRWQPALEAARAHRAAPGVVTRPTAHAPISCAPALLREALAPADIPVTIHCDEDASDGAFLAERTGPWADFHAHLASVRPGHDWQTGPGTAASGVALLDALGVLGPHLGLVHLTAARGADLDRVARTGCTAVLCPRSNLHITGQLPDVPGMVRRGIPLALGTDSRASAPDLDLLADAAVLRAAFPDIPAEIWVRALTEGGARLLACHSEAGRIAPGARPDLLLVEVPDGPNLLERLLDGTRWPRRWLT